jgi:hypothetical protein
MKSLHVVLCVALFGGVMMLPGCGPGGAEVAGIDRGGYQGGAVGTVSGFGSVIVNAVHYDTTNAAIVVNGAPATEADLEVGYVVVVQANVPGDGSAPLATSIEFSHDIVGVIDSVAVAQNRFVMLGQIISVDGATIFGAGIEPASAAGLALLPASQVVKVSGLSASDGSLLATRVELGELGEGLEITGIVSSLDGAASRLQIGALVIDFSGANLEGFTGGQPVVGDRVEAAGNQLTAGGALLATELKRKELELSLEDGDELELEGLITSFASAASFSVSGIPVTTGAQTEFENGAATMLGLNVRIEVEGSLGAGGVLNAAEVEFKTVGEARVAAVTEAVDAAAGTLTVLGITVSVNSATSFEDKSPAELRPFGLQDLSPGDPVRIVGTETAGGALLATQISRTEPLEALELRGVATNLIDPQLTVLGVTVLTDAQTDIENDFFTAAEGRLVQVEGDTTTGSFLAEKVEIKD